MARGKGGGGGKGRFFGKPSKGSPDDILKQVAVARGLRDGSELVVSLGKQRNGMTFDEAMNIMEKELGRQACIDYCLEVYYSEPTHCKRLLKQYNKNLASGGAFGDSYRLEDLEKYCGYRRGIKNDLSLTLKLLYSVDMDGNRLRCELHPNLSPN